MCCVRRTVRCGRSLLVPRRRMRMTTLKTLIPMSSSAASCNAFAPRRSWPGRKRMLMKPRKTVLMMMVIMMMMMMMTTTTWLFMASTLFGFLPAVCWTALARCCMKITHPLRHPCVRRPAPLDPATVHRRLLEGVAAWDDSLPEHSDTNEELSAYCPQVTPVHLLQHRGEGGSALLHAVRAGKVGAVAVLVYCGALAKRRRSSVVAANPQTPEYLLHEVARQPYDDNITPALVQILVENGFSVDEKDNLGATPIAIAEASNTPELQNLLRSYAPYEEKADGAPDESAVPGLIIMG
eukprot:m.622561 g.622561  ORF g.622561 m.622561 type:complete len:295 (-) comp22543_c0_seq37:918-1802(-)